MENCTDDSFDWTEGWNGKAEYIVVHPVIRYATFIGNDSADNKRGIRLRAGTQVELSYALVTRKPKPITLETEQTVASFDNGKSSITNTLISGEVTNELESGKYDNSVFASVQGNKSGYKGFDFTGKYIGKFEGCGAVSADDNWTAGWTR